VLGAVGSAGKQVVLSVLAGERQPGTDGGPRLLGQFELNGTAGLSLYADRSETIWLPEDLDRLCDKASPEIANAARLASLTGLRLSDLLRLSWSHIGAKEIVIPTGKSRGKKAARVPLTRDIRALLDTIPKRSTRVLTTQRRTRPWTANGFGASWARAMKKADLRGRDLHFHDLRGTAATNLYRANLSIRTIAEIMAWSEDRVERLIDRYVKRDEIIDDLVRKIDSA
jgi:integrase